jgi:hypothetical protein
MIRRRTPPASPRPFFGAGELAVRCGATGLSLTLELARDGSAKGVVQQKAAGQQAGAFGGPSRRLGLVSGEYTGRLEVSCPELVGRRRRH